MCVCVRACARAPARVLGLGPEGVCSFLTPAVWKPLTTGERESGTEL